MSKIYCRINNTHVDIIQCTVLYLLSNVNDTHVEEVEDLTIRVHVHVD